jgi:PAS domain S-box-containing protein
MDALIHILHLEDESMDAKLVQAKLAEAGLAYRVTRVQTRDEFEHILRQNAIDIILADYKLPTYDGMSALRLVLEAYPEIPFIFVSGALGEETAIKALTQGATDYVLKQNLTRLAPAVQRALQEARNRRERKQAQQQITLMSFALNSIHEATFMIDENACFQYVNDEACRILGYTRDELLTLSIPDINPELPMERWQGHWCDLKERGAITFEGELKTKQERRFPVEINANYFEYEGRCLDLELAHDITERKKIERERLANLKFFESMDRINRAIQSARNIDSLMSNALDAVLSILDCDRAYLMYPCDPEADSWTAPMERNKPEYPGVLELGLMMPMTPEVAGTTRIILDSDGPVKFGPGADHSLPVDVAEHFGFKCFMAVALYPKVGQPWSFGIHQCSHARIWTLEEERLFQEIGRRLADGLTSWLTFQELEKSESQYRRIVDTANEGIWVIDEDSKTTFVNDRMARMLGYAVQEMVGRPDTDFVHEQEMADHREKRKTRRRGVSESYERRFRCKDGRILWTLVSATPVLDDDHHYKGSFAMVTDITAKKLAEEDLRRLNKELESRVVERTRELETSHADLEKAYSELQAAHSQMLQQEKMAAIGQLAAGVAHEINNPLAFIISNLGTFEEYSRELAEFHKAQEALLRNLAAELPGNDALMELNRLRKTSDIEFVLDDIQQVVAESLDGGNRMKDIVQNLKSFARLDEEEHKLTDLNQGLESTLNIVWNELKYKATIAKSYGDLPQTMCNPGQLNQVFMNLLVNAAQSIEDQGQIDIKTHREADAIVIEIADTGCGIPADKLNRIFEPFFTTKEVGKGTGLGLSIAYDIVEKHGGKIAVQSRPGQGTRFKVSLPIQTE